MVEIFVVEVTKEDIEGIKAKLNACPPCNVCLKARLGNLNDPSRSSLACEEGCQLLKAYKKLIIDALVENIKARVEGKT